MMRTELFWPLAFCGFAAVSLVCGIVAWPLLSATWPRIEEKIDQFRRQPPLVKLVLLLFVGAFVVYGSTKTNLVDQTSGTNIVEIVEGGTNGIGIAESRTNDVDQVGLQNAEAAAQGGDLSQGGSGVLAACHEGGFRFFTSGEDAASPLTVTLEDIARGWQLWEVRTNSNVCYMMPEGATLATNWWLRGAYEDVKPIDFGSWRFPFGTNEHDSLWAFSWGKARFALGDAETEIVAVGSPMSAVPYRSRLWSAADTNGSRHVTWENFVLGRASVADYRLPSASYQLVSAQIELRATGDFIARSNEVETVYRRVDPEDWDGDGWKNEDDYNPYSWDDCNDDFYQELPYDADTNAYCWIEVRPEWNTWIDFQGDGWSNLSDPYFTARAGKTYRVWLLIGKTYSVFAPMPVSVVGRSDDRIEITDVTENSFTAVWPVMFTVAEGRAPTGRSRLGATWNDGGKSFYVMPDPDWLRGDIVWYGACCNVWGDGTNFTYACNGDCTCTGCTVYGDYLYEGYGLSVNGIPCGCHYVPDHGPFKVMQFGFDKSAAIYEDDYTNRPGVVVHPTPSNVVLRCEVYGGTYGGRLTIALNAAGRSKIARVGGNLLPNNVEIPPDTTRVFETEYTPLEPSDRVNDIEATATYVEDFRNESHTATATLTSIRLQLEAIYDAPENHNPSRHVYGVGELVNFVVEPNSSEIFLVTERYDTADDSGYGYELFGGSERISVPYADWYRCPISASNIPPIRVVYKGSEYWPTLTIVEPSEIVTTGAAWGQNAVDVQMYDGDPKCWPFGTVGSAALVTTNYVGPMHVSFMGIAMTEVPCEVEDTVTGCFATNHYKTHTTQAGAGKLHMIGDGNFFFVDGARSGAPEADWQPNSRLNWNIPIGWHRIRSDYADGKQLYGPDYEYNGAIQSRKLLVGGRIDKYKQNRHIDDSGTYRTDKFGHWISRSRWCRVVLDGTTLQWWHLW